jgi:predicted RNase H-like nuclease
MLAPMDLPPTNATVAGVDGVPGGWIAAISSAGKTSLELFDSAAELIGRGMGLVLIDIPIGLPDAPSRTCDKEARRLLGIRRSSVFPAPLRAMLGAPDYVTACAISNAAVGKRCSKQLHAIMPKIKEVDDVMTPDLQGNVREGHPELSFTMMNGGVPMNAHKSEAEGVEQRRGLLRRSFQDLEHQLSTIDDAFLVDALDAYALLWSALRLVRGTSTVIPSSPQIDARGIRAEMVA